MREVQATYASELDYIFATVFGLNAVADGIYFVIYC